MKEPPKNPWFFSGCFMKTSGSLNFPNDQNWKLFEIWMFFLLEKEPSVLGGAQSLCEKEPGVISQIKYPPNTGKKRKTNGSAEIRTRGVSWAGSTRVFGGFVYRYPSLCRVGAFTASGTTEEAMPVEGAAAAASLLGAPVVAEANDGLFCG